jgi:hypothetical protein
VCQLVAELLLWESCVKFKQQKYVKGMIDFRSAWKRFEECAHIRNAIRGTEETGTLGMTDSTLALDSHAHLRTNSVGRTFEFCTV